MNKLTSYQNKMYQMLLKKFPPLEEIEMDLLKKYILAVGEVNLDKYVSDMLSDPDNFNYDPNRLNLKMALHYSKKYAFLGIGTKTEKVINQLHDFVWKVREYPEGIENFPKTELVVDGKKILSHNELMGFVNNGVNESARALIDARLRESRLESRVGESLNTLLPLMPKEEIKQIAQ